MESSYYSETRDQNNNALDYVLRFRMIELAKTKEKLRQAKDDVAQSWIRARPLIDKLEKLKSNLANTKSRNLISNTIMTELEDELENTENSIRLKMGIESKLRSKASELNQSLDKTHEEMEQLGEENYEQKRKRTELKQALRVKKQSLKALQLTLRAIRLESEAIGASVERAVTHIYNSEAENSTVELSCEEYYALAKRAKEETLLADWRISISVEHRLVAEESRDLSLKRLEEILIPKIKENEYDEQKGEYLYTTTDEEEKLRISSEIEVTDKEEGNIKAQPKLIPWSSKESSLQLNRRLPVVNKKLKRSKRSVKIKEPSLLVRIRSYLLQKVASLFC